MTVTVERVERELNIPKDELIKEGIRRYLEFELRSLKAEMSKILVNTVFTFSMNYAVNLRKEKSRSRSAFMT